jgi:hypothetical protein
MDGRRPANWAHFLRLNKVEVPLLAEIPYIPVIGSHEYCNDMNFGFPNFKAIFEYPRFFVLDVQGAAIFVLDSDFIIDQSQVLEDDYQDELFERWFDAWEGAAEPAWLEREFAARDTPHKIVCMHHPPLSFGFHHGDWENPAYGRNLRNKQHRLLQLFKKHDVKLVFCGHEHYYEHNILRYQRDKTNSPGEIHFVITGGGGVPLRDLGSEEMVDLYLREYAAEGWDVSIAKRERMHHYCVTEISSGKLCVKVMGVTGDPSEPTRLIEEIHFP